MDNKKRKVISNSIYPHTLFDIRSGFLICVFLCLMPLTTYWQVTNHQFVYDDECYITNNPHLKKGLTLDNIVWSLTAVVGCNWHPLTLFSHMLDCQFYGLNSGRHHVTSLLFHIANIFLLFFVLKRMTNALWQSAFVAAIFAIHPLNVETVAWVSERKNVLSTFFWLLTMWSYVRYAERPGIKRYLPILFFLALGLMSKPMLVTLPFILLLLDYWPLKRFRPGQSGGIHLILEKIPLFALVAASSIVTFFLQQSGGAVVNLNRVSFYLRFTNAIVSYIKYIINMLWPFKLAAFYPYPESIPNWHVTGACLLLLAITFFAVKTIRQYPYIALGWPWYLGSLVPVIGLVQVGGQAMADRYTYVPVIGLFIIIAWGTPELLERWRYKNTVIAIIGTSVLSIFAATTLIQVRYWKDNITLYRHGLQVTTKNYEFHNNLGYVLEKQGNVTGAIRHYFEAVRINPGFALAHNNLGNAIRKQGNITEAIRHLSEAVRITPCSAMAHINLGYALESQGRLTEAIGHFSEALRLNPISVETYNILGLTLIRQGRIDEAIKRFNEALKVNPDRPEIHYNLGVTLADQGRMDAAIEHYSTALQLNPNQPNVHVSLGIALINQNKTEEAMNHFFDALNTEPNNIYALYNIGSILINLGRIEEAISHLSEALKKTPGDTKIQTLLNHALKLSEQQQGKKGS